MGRRLVRRHGDDAVTVVSAERDIVTVCRKSRPALPAAVYAEDPIPDGWGG